MATIMRANDGCYLLIKRAGFSRDEKRLSAYDSAVALLQWGRWPIWKGTRNKDRVKAGDQVAVYLAGDEKGTKRIVATARVQEVMPWAGRMFAECPILVDGIPLKVLVLTDAQVLAEPVEIRPLLPRLRFLPANPKKWGVAFMGGMRSLSAQDFRLVTGGGRLPGKDRLD
jgi:hypothetical protein